MKSNPEIPKDQQAYQGIRDLMFSRRLVPGQKIIYRDLEEQLRMSKTPILTALVRLEQEGLVVSSHHRGYYVKRWNRAEISQVLELKEKLQDILIGYAIHRYTAEELLTLRQALDGYLNQPGELYDLTRWQLDSGFHAQIARMSGNAFLASMLDRIYDMLFIAVDLTLLTPLIQRYKVEHERVFLAIEAKDVEKAKETLRLHDRIGSEIMLKSLVG